MPTMGLKTFSCLMIVVLVLCLAFPAMLPGYAIGAAIAVIVLARKVSRRSQGAPVAVKVETTWSSS